MIYRFLLISISTYYFKVVLENFIIKKLMKCLSQEYKRKSRNLSKLDTQFKVTNRREIIECGQLASVGQTIVPTKMDGSTS